MHSELFRIGPIVLRMYGLCMAVGFLSAWRMLIYLCKRTGQNSDHVAMLLSWVMVAAIIGARTEYVIEHWAVEFAHNLAAVVRIDKGGLMFYGGFIGALIPYVFYALRFRKNFFEMGDISATVLPLGHAFGRLGCFMHGCCYGKRSDAWLGVAFPKGSDAWYEQLRAGLIPDTALRSLPVIPTQLIESLATLTLFVVLFALYPKRYRQRGFVSGVYLIGYAVLRFPIEYLRGDPRAAVGPFSISQTISIVIFAAGVGCIAWSRRAAAQQKGTNNVSHQGHEDTKEKCKSC